jgi:hypothetical protein
MLIKMLRYKHRPYVHLHGAKTPDWKHFHHHKIIPSPQGPSLFVNLAFTIYDVEIVHEGVATSEFFVLGKLQQPQKMKSSERI